MLFLFETECEDEEADWFSFSEPELDWFLLKEGKLSLSLSNTGEQPVSRLFRTSADSGVPILRSEMFKMSDGEGVEVFLRITVALDAVSVGLVIVKSVTGFLNDDEADVTVRLLCLGKFRFLFGSGFTPAMNY